MEYNEKNVILAEKMFPEINETIEDLENKYKERTLKNEDATIVCRIAPSPTGFLHTGSLCTALVNYLMAKKTGGVFFLRIEDTDQKREVEGSTESLTREMQNFLVVPDEGVISKDKEVGDYGPYTQSKREKIYKIVAKELVKRGLAYPCFCSSEDLEKIRNMQEEKKIIPGYYSQFARCRNIDVEDQIKKIENGEKYIVRFRSPGNHLRKISYTDLIRGKIEIAENDMDIVIIKSDLLPTYHFAHVVDDHFMRTNLVLRGEEWISSVPIHIQLFETIGFKVPKYAHLPTIMKNDNGSRRKLSKRKDMEAAVSYYVENGYPALSLIEYLMGIINSDFEIWRRQNPDKSIYDFDIKLEKVGVSGALFDIVKLNDVSKQVISRMSSQEVLDSVLEYSKQYDKELYEDIIKDMEYSTKVFALERDNTAKVRKDIAKWSDVPYEFAYFFNHRLNNDIKENGYNFKQNISKEKIKECIEKYSKIYDENVEKDIWFSDAKKLASELSFCTDMKEYKLNPDKYIGSIADFMEIIRVAITNRVNSPDIFSIMKVIGKEEVMKRFNDVTCNI